MTDNAIPNTLMEAIKYFSNQQVCIDFVASMKWPNGVAVCPQCSNDTTYYLANRRVWKCRSCKKQFSVKVGTIFEDSPLGLDKWLMAIWMIANCKNGISSYEIHRAIGVTQKSAWFMLHRIRLAMESGSIDKLSGTVEADETWIGGDAKNMHAKRRRELNIKPGKPKHKTGVMGMVERGGKVKAKAFKDTRVNTLCSLLHENVEHGSNLITDEASHYNNLYTTYVHEVITHSIEYVRDNVHTNSIENFWSLLKRTIKGTYVSVSPAHLQRYIEEQVYRYNERKGNDQKRFVGVSESITGKRLTYAQLIGYETV